MNPTAPVPFLRRTAQFEGLSFLVLLFIAMPLKYFAGQPLAVKVLGMIHGVLFVVLCLALLRAHLTARWNIGRSALVFASSLIPFGPMLIDSRLRAWEAEAASGKPQA
ncbi:MAG: DUF3817 domain-containing protein [Verrucomicrobiaceae bacterium]|nr:MAG: DUF3817 domain-containing protein [Verrucomicrobiaceae bacterium]